MRVYDLIILGKMLNFFMKVLYEVFLRVKEN